MSKLFFSIRGWGKNQKNWTLSKSTQHYFKGGRGVPTSSPRPKRVLEFLIHHCVFVKCIFKYKSKTKNLKMLTFNFFVSILIDSYSWDLFEPLVGQILQDNLVGVPSHSTTHNLNLEFSKETRIEEITWLVPYTLWNVAEAWEGLQRLKSEGKFILLLGCLKFQPFWKNRKLNQPPPLCSLIELTM